MFYDRYAQLCKRKGVSMSAAALEAGLSKSLVTKWKVNKVDVPSPDVLKKLSVYFNVPVAYLLDEEETKKEPVPVQDELPDDVREIMELLKDLSEEKAKLLLPMIRAAVEAD